MLNNIWSYLKNRVFPFVLAYLIVTALAIIISITVGMIFKTNGNLFGYALGVVAGYACIPFLEDAVREAINE